MAKHSSCSCALCGFLRRSRRLNKQITPAVDRLIDDILTHYCNEIEDLNFKLIRLQENPAKMEKDAPNGQI